MTVEGLSPAHSTQRVVHEAAWLAGAWLLVILVARYTTLDHTFTALFYDTQAAGFPLRYSAFWNTVMHSGLKYLSLAIWLTLFLVWLLPARWALNPRLRGVIGFTLLVAPLSALAVSLLRSLSAHSCPWELAAYGGAADYFRFFDSLPANPGPGHCAPSGHASVGFVWIAGYLAAPAHQPVRRAPSVGADPVSGRVDRVHPDRARCTFRVTRAAHRLGLLRRGVGK